jgi:predicted glycosyltransferase involved in capsule biosynthesis
MELLAAPSLSLGRECFGELGGFDESFPLAGAEDHEFLLRRARRGSRCCSTRRSTAFTTTTGQLRD